MPISNPAPMSQPAWAICGTCGEGFIFAKTPILLDAFIVLMKHAHCPACGQEAKRLFVCDHKPTKADRRDAVVRVATLRPTTRKRRTGPTP